MTADVGRLRLRAGTERDVEALTRQLLDGFGGYRAFQPPGWEPPRWEDEEPHVRASIEAGAWSLLALDGDELAGHAVWVPAPDEAGVAHLRACFVGRPWWGTGLAPLLLHRAVDAMGAAGHPSARLVTPAGQARARRFYEREGWGADGPPFWEDALQMSLVRYRRPLVRP